jgi:hypothetical protein
MDCGRKVYGCVRGLSSLQMTTLSGHRVRWVLIWVLVAAWFAALALNIAGNAAHILLLVAIGILVYELLIPEQA